MSDEHRTQPLVLAIFGITGDLAQRKLLPALYRLIEAGELTDTFKIIGISRREVALQDVYAQLHTFVGTDSLNQAIVDKLTTNTEMRQMDLLESSDYESLLSRLHEVEAELGEGVNRVYYLSIPSQAFLPIIERLGQTGHAAPLTTGALPRLLIEKPFGYDLTSAHELVDALNQHFVENQIYRIDHYVAKETVQNMLVFRFQNPLFANVWNNKHIDHISIVAHEKIGIERRADFYEQTGALRDLIQSHLLQLLAITAMRRPTEFTSEAIHAEKLNLLKAVRPTAPDKVLTEIIRGQYAGYREEVANPDSIVETYARLELRIDTPEWEDVPIILETGKALAEKRTEVSVCFRQPQEGTNEENKLVFRIQPSEGVSLQLQAKQPGVQNSTEAAEMSFDYASAFDTRTAEAYERVIVDAIRGDQTLFASAAEVIRSWEIVENILEQWSHGPEGLIIYPQNSVTPITRT